MRKPKEREFWVTNICTFKDISLSDLRLTLRRGKSVNLLDSKHYYYTYDQLIKSMEEGSLKAKGKWVRVRETKPEVMTKFKEIQEGPRYLKPIRNKVQVETPYYEELEFDNQKQAEETFASEDAEAAYLDREPVLPVDPKFKDIK